MQFVKFFIKIDIIDKAIAALKFLDLYTLRADTIFTTNLSTRM